MTGRRRAGVTLATLLAAAGVATGAGGLHLRARLRASLPRLEGRLALPGLRAPVTVERDGRGVPTLRGLTRLDLARATGFVHAQDRFFQMDLLRRRSAGELSELLGRGAAVALDRRLRLHRFRSLAERVLARVEPAERETLAAYAGGVNAGLSSLGDVPPEYVLLQASPRPWEPVDTVLCLVTMFLELQDPNARHESALGVLHDTLPPPLAAFLAPPGTEWDAPLEGPAFAPPPLPDPEVIDLRGRAGEAPARFARATPDDMPAGSNNWAVSGRRTADGRAILAGDMHLGLGLPNTWYRASLEWKEPQPWRVTGVTLPGTPGVVAGSNGRVAWAYTNSYGDWSDLVVLEPVPGRADAYRAPGGPRAFERSTEVIRVKGAGDVTVEARWTAWGPVVDRDHRGRERALRWTAHDAEAVNLRSLALETAPDVEVLLAAASRSGLPAQNMVAVDAGGHLGWTIAGRVPRRRGLDGRRPESWADGSRGWDGYLEPEAQPRLVDPPEGRVWTANARVVGGAVLDLVGDGGYDLGARAAQIRDGLRDLASPTERDLLALQLDDRALFLGRWRELLLATLSPAAVDRQPLRAQLRRHVEDWGGRASVDSVGYRAVRVFREAVSETVFAPLLAPCLRADRRFAVAQVGQAEGPLWALVSRRPAHLLPPPHRSWDELLLSAADTALGRLQEACGSLARCTWGRRNEAPLRHTLSRAVPALSPLLDLSLPPLPGDSHMPRVQAPGFGASQRMVVSPGAEEDGTFHMPGGQCGHPLSPHYADGTGDWEQGRPSPFLPGPAIHVLALHP